MESLLQDARYALRGLVRSPTFAIAATLTLALGIGANTAIFSVVDGVLLRPLPYPDPGRIVMVFETRPERSPGNFSYANLEDVREHATLFEAVAAWGAGDATLTGGGEAARLDGARVTGEFFRVFGVEAALGRTILPEETMSGRDRVVVLGHGVWRDRFGGEEDVIGRTAVLDGEAHTVIGVMPPGFAAPYDARVWRPFVPTTDPIRLRAFRNIRGIARLADGADPEAAEAEVDGIMGALAEEHPDVNAGAGARIQALRDVIVADTRPMLLVLLGAVGFLLLIGCVNVANLLIARTTTRRREIGIRAALGADRGRLARQLLVESALLATVAGAAGVVFAIWSTDALLALAGDMIPRADLVVVDLRALGFAAAISLGTAGLFGVAPALRASRMSLVDALRSGRGETGDPRARRLRGALVVAELALTVVLVSGAGLLIRSFAHLQQVDPGFTAERLVGFELALPATRYDTSDQVTAFYDELFEQLEALPGVRSAGAALTAPVGGGGWTTTLRIEDRPRPESELPSVAFNVISPGYFSMIDTPLLRGREFDPDDDADAPGVVVINRAAAERFWPGENPLGRRINAGPNPDAPYSTIVGVVGNVREGRLERTASPTLYFPLAREAFRAVTIIARTDVEAASVLPGVRRRVAELDPELPVLGPGTVEEHMSTAVAEPRLNATILTALAALALLLASVGIYGVIAYAVGQRTREIGLRIAIGADRGDVIRLVLADGLRLAAIGVGLGLLGAAAASRTLSGMLYEVSPADPLTFGAVAGVVTVAALAATLVPALRAAGVDPMVALTAD